MTRELTDQDIAGRIVDLARKQKERNPMDVLRDAVENDHYGLSNKLNRLVNIKKIIGKVGGMASKQRADDRRVVLKLERTSARQGRLF